MVPEVVSNAGPLIHLAAIGRFDLLKTIFSVVHIPRVVHDEVVTHGSGQAGASEVSDGLRDGWIHRHEIKDQTALALLLDEIHAGEAEVILLASKLGCKVLLDDGYARGKAAKLGLTVSGTVGVLMVARKFGLIDDLGAEIDKLVASGFYLSPDLSGRLLSTHA